MSTEPRPVEQELSGFLPSREFLFSILVPVLDLHEQELVRKKPEDSLVARYTNDLKKDKLEVLLEFGQGYNLQGRGLQLANLKQTNLLKVDFRGANLKKAKLSGAQMQGANLYKAQLQRAKLEFAQLQGANLVLAHLQGADLEGAELQGADLWGAEMLRANLIEAKLQGANLLGAQLQGALLGETQLQGANLNSAQLQEAYFGLGSILGANVGSAQLQGAEVAKTNFYKANFFSQDQLQATYGHAVSAPGEKKTTGEKSTPLPLGDPTAFLQARKNLLCRENEFLAIAKNVLFDRILDQDPESPADQGLILKWMYQDPACRPRLQAIKNAKLGTVNNWLHLELEKLEYDFSPQKAGGADR